MSSIFSTIRLKVELYPLSGKKKRKIKLRYPPQSHARYPKNSGLDLHCLPAKSSQSPHLWTFYPDSQTTVFAHMAQISPII